MQIVCLFGGPRAHGNSAEIARELAQKLAEKGAVIKFYYLNKMQYRGCQGCLACKTTKEECVLQDDLTTVLQDIKDCDLVIMSSPVYFGDITGQAKLMFDRMFSYLPADYVINPNAVKRLTPKKWVMVLAQGRADAKSFSYIFPNFADHLKRLGFNDTYLIRAVGARKPGDAMQNPEIQRQIDNVLAALV